jgi:hypothetical protein
MSATVVRAGIDLLRLLFEFRTDRTAVRLALFGGMLGVLVLVGRLNTSIPATPLTDGHAIAAIELAMTRAFCGAPSAYPPQYRVPHYLRDHPVDGRKPLRQVAAEMAGSVEAYCAAVSEPFLNNENSLTVIQAWLLSAEPSLSLDGLGTRLHQIRVAILIVFAAVCLRSGLSAAISAAVVFVGMKVLGRLDYLQHTTFPLMLPSVLLAISVYAFSWPRLRDGGWPWLVATGLTAGALAGLAVNLRTSYWPVFVAMLAVVLIFAVREWQLGVIATIGRAALVVGVFGASLWGVQYRWIDRLLPENFPTNTSHHPIAHPLVLALANPENALSRREGIEWRDDVGVRIAASIDSQATYLGPRYGPALTRYYRQLWTDYPGEMARIYWVKFQLAGVPIIDALRAGALRDRLVPWLMAPLAYVRSGVLWIGACLIGIALAYVFCAPTAGSFALLVAMLCAAAGLLLTESAIIMPDYRPQYHSYLMMFFPMASLFAVQGVMQVAIRQVRAAAARGAQPSTRYNKEILS